jgi:hypothetical protein
MPFDVNAFLAAHQDKLTAEEQTELRAGYLRNEDYQRNFNRLKQEHEQRIAAEDTYHNQLTAYEQRVQLANVLEQRLGVPLEQLVQTANPALLQSPTTGEMVSRADIDALRTSMKNEVIAELAPAVTGTFHLAVNMPRYSWDYQQRYGKMLDGQKFVDFCRDNNISDSDLGFKLYTSEDEKTYLADQHQKELQRVREETERSVLSRHHIPEPSSRPTLRSPLMRTFTPQTDAPAPVPAPVVTPVAPAPAPSAVPASVATAAPDLAARMQADFLKAL